MSRFSLFMAVTAMVAAPALAQNSAAQDNAARAYGIATTSNIWAGVYTDQQAAQGQKFYAAACGDCHGEHLDGDPGQGFPGLAGPGFMVEWDGQTMADLVRHIHTRPNDNPGDMDPITAVEMAAFILNQNGVPSGKTPLSTDATEQAKILFTETKPK
jgi:mono/diheme cytochrome c family protein